MKRLNKTLCFTLILTIYLHMAPLTGQDQLPSMIEAYANGAYEEIIRLHGNTPLDSLSPKISFYLGLANASMNDFEGAARYFQYAVEKDSTAIKYRLQYAGLLRQLGRIPEAENQYQFIIMKDSTYSPAIFQLGMIRFETREYASSVLLFTRATEIRPRDFLGHYYLGCSLLQYEKTRTDSAKVLLTDSAKEHLACCLSLNPHFTQASILLASIRYQENAYGEAFRLYETACRQSPDEPELWYKMGLCLDKMNRPADAIKYYRKAAVLDSLNINPAYFAHLGQAYFTCAKYDSAADAYTKAGHIDDENPILFQNAGLAWAQIDSSDKAIFWLTRACQVSHPEKISTILYQLGSIYDRRNSYQEAFLNYAKALEFNPKNMDARFYNACACEQLKKRSLALISYKTFLEIASNDTTQLERIRYAKQSIRRLEKKLVKK